MLTPPPPPEPLFQALAELRAQQQQLQQEVAALRGTAGETPPPRDTPGTLTL